MLLSQLHRRPVATTTRGHRVGGRAQHVRTTSAESLRSIRQLERNQLGGHRRYDLLIHGAPLHTKFNQAPQGAFKYTLIPTP